MLGHTFQDYSPIQGLQDVNFSFSSIWIVEVQRRFLIFLNFVALNCWPSLWSDSRIVIVWIVSMLKIYDKGYDICSICFSVYLSTIRCGSAMTSSITSQDCVENRSSSNLVLSLCNTNYSRSCGHDMLPYWSFRIIYWHSGFVWVCQINNRYILFHK